MPNYRTRLFEFDRNLSPQARAWGLGWSVWQRHLTTRWLPDSGRGPEPDPDALHHINATIAGSRTEDGGYIQKLAPELVIEAKNFTQARRVMRLIIAGFALSEMQLIEDDAIPVPDDMAEWPSRITRNLDVLLNTKSATHGYFRAAQIAAKASKKMVWQHALAKYYHGFRSGGHHWMETHPNYGENTATTSDPMEYIDFALSIVTFFSVIEEMDLQVKASAKKPSKLPTGEWNPEVLDDLKKRMEAVGIPSDSTMTWILRGSPTRIEKQHKPPEGQPTDWTAGRVRDREIPLYDAINYASLLRSRVSAHRTSARTKSLTLAHTINVQMLARDLLLRVLDD
jgi:hypothetical protein